ncbi:hypothetical protein GW750_00420 [bacterium]|nr:hypothetical protein [bacterium]
MKPSYTIRDVTLADCDEIASLLRDNFLKFSPYADFLSETEKQGYITLNTAERLRTKCKQKEYEMHKVMIDES